MHLMLEGGRDYAMSCGRSGPRGLGRSIDRWSGVFSPRRFPFFYGWVIVAVAFVTMGLGVSTRTAFSLLFPRSSTSSAGSAV